MYTSGRGSAEGSVTAGGPGPGGPGPQQLRTPEEARALADANVKLVFWYARRAAARWGLSREEQADVESECAVALMKAAAQWEPSRGRFSTFFSVCAMTRVYQWARDRNRERARAGRAVRLGRRRDDPGEQAEVAAPDCLAEMERAEHARGTVARLLPELRERDRLVLEGRFLRGETLEELGRELGITREAVRQATARATERAHAAAVGLGITVG